LKAIVENNYELAGEELKSARKELTEAHRVHTDVIQSEARGENVELSILFSHAQDTLMTISSELELTKSLIEIF
jgi:PTS system cellobiose-specific IIA component